jgi:protein TonB
MSGASASQGRLRHGQAWLRWGACLVVVVALHATMLLTLRRSVPAFGTSVPEAIMIDLAPAPPPPTPAPALPETPPPEPAPPEPAPPDTPPDPVPPDPTPQLQEPPPPEPMPLPVPDVAPPVPQAEVTLPPPLPPKTRPPPRPRAVAKPQAVVAPADTPAPAQTTPQVAAPAPSAQAQATWEGALVAHLARFKRFPPAAQRRGEQGIVLMHVTMTRGGTVVSMTVVRGSGYADLDEEAKAWMSRAQPLPAAPPEVTAQQPEIVVPLRFTLR